MPDSFENNSTGLSSPIKDASAVIPNDAADLSSSTRGIWVGGAGDINVDLVGSGTVVIAGVPAGTLLPLRVKRIRSTNTTATLIVALW